ncbi:glycoside hydrolase family 140 protein [Pseudonocardia nigra]|uniref:glycoside hydrolase family 140 protein n=1 Tax=Pseudonocardia nigra TaxID=1921578 RepID=UPI001C5D1F7D|nr:glycoside hydrolase family 140 protein [Pseudonocardia nigra]
MGQLATSVRAGTRGLVAAAVAAAVVLPATAHPVDATRAVAAQQADPLGPLHVSENGRYFVRENGRPFFWLADTAWSLFVNLDRDEVERYLDARAEQGFNVIQAVGVFPQAGGPGPNPYGDDPLDGGMTPAVTEGADPGDDEQYDFWDHVDFVVDAAAQRGMRIALLPAWADKQAGSLVTTKNAKEYGEFLGERYGDDVVWVMGGDSPADGVEDVWRDLAEGVAVGANGSVDYTDLLMTYHPRGDQTSATWFHDDEWLSFNMLQGGHCRRWNNLFGLIDGNFSERPPKPFLDGESIYEDHPICWKPEDGFSTDEDVRRNAYWSVFGGAAGHTYGHHAVWQFLEEGARAQLGARGSWTDALDFPAGGQMQHLRALMESRPYLTRVPDQEVLTSDVTDLGAESIRATRDEEGSYLMVYTAAGREFDVDTSVLSGSDLRAWWYDPRTGEAIDAGSVPREESVEFFPPETEKGDDGPDWVLVVDDAARGFAPPGTPFAPQEPAAPQEPPAQGEPTVPDEPAP